MLTTAEIPRNSLFLLSINISINSTKAKIIHILSIRNNPNNVNIENLNIGSTKISEVIAIVINEMSLVISEYCL